MVNSIDRGYAWRKPRLVNCPRVSRDREADKSVQWTDLSGERRSGPKAREAGTPGA